MKQISVTIVMPVYNEAAILRESLAKVLSAAGEDAEVIAVDGSSSDSSAEIIKEYPEVNYLLSPRRGRSFQMNYGAARAQGDWILFLHADSSLPAGWRDEVEAAAKGRCSYGAFKVSYGAGEVLSFISRCFAVLCSLRSYVTKYPYGDQAIFVQQNFFSAVGRFPEISLMEDLAFSRKAYLQEKRFYRSDKKVAVSYRRFKGKLIKTALILRIFPLLYRLGVSPVRLEKWYGVVR